MEIQIECEMENLTNLQADPDKQWYFLIKCTQCHEEHANPVVCSRTDQTEMHGSNKSNANLVMKCQFCKREMSLAFVGGDLYKYCAEDVGQFKTMAVVECRGMEVIDWIPMVFYSHITTISNDN